MEGAVDRDGRFSDGSGRRGLEPRETPKVNLGLDLETKFWGFRNSEAASLRIRSVRESFGLLCEGDKGSAFVFVYFIVMGC